MEDKHKNKLHLEIKEFLKLIKDQIESEDESDLLLKLIEKTLIHFNKKDIKNLTIKQDKNLTSNIIYFIALDSSEDEYQLVLKI